MQPSFAKLAPFKFPVIVMQGPFQSWLAPAVRDQQGIYWCAAWYGFVAIACFAASAFETGAIGAAFLLLVGGLHAYAALGLLRGLKPAWHIATFLAFATIVTRSLATACAPGEIAAGDKLLFEAALDIVVLAIAITIFVYLRKPVVRRLYNVPETYRVESSEQE